ncbi:MAG: DNA repair protein RadA [Actinomycetota bacterium]|nr:DNA repair protein RadA [Actinomycetota bacterium]
MTKVRTVYRCGECGTEAPKWAGRCAGCQAWNSLIEEVERSGPSLAMRAAQDAPELIGEIEAGAWHPRPTGIAELDRVLGGGLVAGSVTLVGGEPGIGKSTLLLQVLAALGASGARCLLVTAEESKQQVHLRAERLVPEMPNVWLVSETELPHIVAHVEAVAPTHLVVDSIQTVLDPEITSAPGSVSQVRECAYQLVRLSKARAMATVLVGHVTKDGGLAGPRVLEHVVDTVLSFDGDRHHSLRLLRAAKHRFGATGELGIFQMTERGLQGVPDAGGLFLSDRRSGVAGSAVVPTIDGHRPLLVEVQALVVPASNAPMPRRSAQGLDAGRLSLLLAVLQQRLGMQVGKADVYALAAGGVKVAEPGADLALCLALQSSDVNRALPDDLVAIGEVGLGGEVRQVGQMERRMAEAARLGFTRALVPTSAPAAPAGMTTVPVATVEAAVEAAGLRRKSRKDAPLAPTTIGPCPPGAISG